MSESNEFTNAPRPPEPPFRAKRKPKRSQYQHTRRSIFFPLLLVAVGVFLVLNNMGYVQGDTWQVLLRLWPLLMIVGGLDGLIQQNGYVGSIMWAGTGGVLLAWNLGYLSDIGIDGWNILRLWPVLLVAWGLDLVIGRRGWISALVGIPVGLAMVAGVLWLGTNPLNYVPAPQQEKIVQQLEDADEVKLSISNKAGYLNISSGAEPTNLIEGLFLLREGERIDSSYAVENGDGVYTLENSHDVTAMVPFMNNIGWDIKLNMETPLRLSADMGAGEHLLDMSGLLIEKLQVDLGAGRAVITLPEDSDFQGNIDMGVGDLTLRIPQGTNVRIEADTGLTAITYPDNYQKSDEVITSPNAWKAEELIELSVDLPLGILTIEQIP